MAGGNFPVLSARGIAGSAAVRQLLPALIFLQWRAGKQ
jgi:hypothetical protein